MHFTLESSRENKCKKIVATGIFLRKILQQEFSRKKYRNRNFLEKIIATGFFSIKFLLQNGKKWKYLLRDLE
jgi:hypothetical protein